MTKQSISDEKFRKYILAIVLPVLAVAAMILGVSTRAQNDGDGSKRRETRTQSKMTDPTLPRQVDARDGTPRGTDERQPTAIQARAIGSLRDAVGEDIVVRYNGLTATPMNIYNQNGYLTAASDATPELIARDFIRQWREVFRFDENDLNSLKLVSRATSEEGITILLFQQRFNNIPVYHGEVLVNINRAGQIINVGGDSFPRLTVNNSVGISPAQAVTNAARDMNITDFSPRPVGEAKILTTHGDLPAEYSKGVKFARSVFTEDISVQTVVFPVGATGRIAYKFNLVTPQYHGIMWMNIVDAQDGTILKRVSLTSHFGGPGGGNSIPRKGSFRPDVQNMLEAHNAAGSAHGKVFDTAPVTLSRVGGVGRAVRTGTDPSNWMIARPTYDLEATVTLPYRHSLYATRRENPMPFLDPTLPQPPQPLTPDLLGQLTRGFPDAANPSPFSPFGWFYLPTGNGGTEITSANVTTGTTRAAGYTMAAEAQTRNLAVNSPNGNGTQPFSATVTPVTGITLADGRTLNSVYQSNYTEGNNVTVSDDRENDNDATKGIRGYSAGRQFNAAYYDYYASYELGGTDATGGGTGSTTPVTYPASANPDVYPATVNLFYFNNLEHDYLYSIGFTEAFWNFQFDNFGKGGAGNDGIVAEVQDGSGTDNANMGTPADGSSPRMQMYLFTDGGFRRSDGDLDWDVVAHEQYHGVSNRSAAKGGDSCLGTPLVGESGGMGEGWSDNIASSLSDDDSEGEYVTGQGDNGIRRVPYTNYRYSYGSINDVTLNVRKNSNADVIGPDANPGGIPFEVHDIGEVWAAVLWDVRELLIVKENVGGTYPGIFFDGTKRFGGGANFYIGNRLVQSVDAQHPINYRQGFGTDDGTTAPGPFPVAPTLVPARDIIRPGLLASEHVSFPGRNGPLATAVSNGARLADKLVLRSLQITPCNPTFVDMRDAMLAADREITGGENQAVLWRAFASHGVGVSATSSGKTNGTGQQGGPPAIVEDFTVPVGVSDCETLGPLPAPAFGLTNTLANTVTVTINGGIPVVGASNYVIARSTSANGPFVTVATIPAAETTYQDNDSGAGLVLGQVYYYQVHAARSASCVGTASTNNITVTVGAPLSPAPSFSGVGQVADPKTGTSLILSWNAATSANPGANIVYDIYRVINVANTDFSVTPATFAPDNTAGTGNRIAQGLAGTSFTNTGLTLGQQYYYIVRARDTTNGKIDSNNVGNTVTKYNAPSTIYVSPAAPFAFENFELAAADARFTPILVDSMTPDKSLAAFQRVPNINMAGGGTSITRRSSAVNSGTTAMYAPNFDPGNAGQGGPSDFFAQISPSALSRGSFLEFDHRIGTESTFDGGTIEVILGDPALLVTPYPNNTTTFDLDDYIVESGYNGNLNGTIVGVMSSPLLGRRAFTGTTTLSHVKVALGDFASGGAKNPGGLPVFVRFHMTSDAGTFVDGWYVDNLVLNTYTFAPSAATVPVGGRVLKQDGAAVNGALVTITSNDGTAWTARTSSLGYFQFDSIPAGATYTLTVSHKQYQFSPRTLAVSDEISGFDITAEP